MPFSDILNIIPKLDEKQLKEMQKKLEGRFTRVAKKFGQGLVGSLKGGGLLGIGLGLIDKLLNPIKEVQEAIDRTLKQGGDLVSNAEYFGSTPGQLAKLRALGEAKGVDNEQLYNLISKYMIAVNEAQTNPTEPSAVRQYVGQENYVEGFYAFIRKLQKMNKADQIAVQQQVFGEKQILKMADFLQTDFADLEKALNLRNTQKITRDAYKIDRLADQKDIGEARQNYYDISAKAGRMNSTQVDQALAARQMGLDRENRNISNYENLKAMSNTMEKIQGIVETQVGKIGEVLARFEPQINKLVAIIEKFQKSKWAKGIFGFFDK